MSKNATYEVISQSAAVFADPLALFVEHDPLAVEIKMRLARGIRFEGYSVWRKLPKQAMKVQWIALVEGGYILPDCVRRIHADR